MATHRFNGRLCIAELKTKAIVVVGKIRYKKSYDLLYFDKIHPKKETISKAKFEKEAFIIKQHKSQSEDFLMQLRNKWGID